MLGAALKTAMAARCSVLATVVTRVKVDLPSVAAAARPATTVLPLATAPAAAAMTSRHTDVLASKAVAGRLVSMGPCKGVQRTVISKSLCYVYHSSAVLKYQHFM